MENNQSIHSQAEIIKKDLERQEKVKVSVALFGHSGAGKSTIINKLLGIKKAEVGVETDTTTKEEHYEWEGITLTDLPGYNTKRFPANEYLEKFKILTNFDLFICVFEGKLSKENTEFFTLLKEKGKVCIFVRSKSDQIWDEEKTYLELTEAIKTDLLKQIKSYDEKIIFTSGRNNSGFDKLQDEIFRNLEDSKRVRWVLSSKAYSKDFLEKKRVEAEKLVTKYAAISAANGLNPVPGVDVAVDITTLVSLFKHLRAAYGLSDSSLSQSKMMSPAMMQTANNLLKFATKEGLLILLKRFGTTTATKQVSKYIPFVGQAIAASAGFYITKSAGNSYLKDCHLLATEILENELNKNLSVA